MNSDQNSTLNILIQAMTLHSRTQLVEELDTAIFMLELASLAIKKAQTKINVVYEDGVDLSPVQTQIQEAIGAVQVRMASEREKL